MTAIIDRDIETAAHSECSESNAVVRRSTSRADRRAGARARGISPRLAQGRNPRVAGASLTSSNESTQGAVRTVAGPVRVTGARGAAQRSVERSRVRPSTGHKVRGASRVGGCARRSAGPSWALCLALAVGTFVAVLVLFGGGPQSDAGASEPVRPALTSVVTVRSGQSLDQIAAEIAPGRAPATVIDEISRINGLQNGLVHSGQTLITPRY